MTGHFLPMELQFAFRSGAQARKGIYHWCPTLGGGRENSLRVKGTEILTFSTATGKVIASNREKWTGFMVHPLVFA